MSTDQILAGIGLTLALAVVCRVVAEWLRLPALIVLLPVGYIAGASTDVVNPDKLLGPAFGPLVSLAVAVILFDSGLGLRRGHLRGATRTVVRRLIGLGTPVTWALAAGAAALLLGMSGAAALMLGAILVVSGPTVVQPLLGMIRPRETAQRILVWEGSLIDPVGGILGALVFHAIQAGQHDGFGYQVGQFLFSVAVGAAGGALGVGLLMLLLRGGDLGSVLGAQVAVGTVVAVAAACDVLRDDAGLIASILMGLAVANMRRFHVPARRPFFETTIQLTVAVLFVSISATIGGGLLRDVLWPALGLAAVLVLLVRPLVAWLATARTGLSRGERMFIGWMDPRGIVAASTAATFGAPLAAQGIAGAEKILPVTFLIIVATVTVYGLTGAPVARLVGATRPARSQPLLIGDEPWVYALGRCLRVAGLGVVMATADAEHRARARAAGLEVAGGGLLAAATGAQELEGVTDVLLLTGEDDFNALASEDLRDNVDLPVYRLAPAPGGYGIVAGEAEGEVLFSAVLTGPAIRDRCAHGASVVTRPADGGPPDGYDVLFVVHRNGRLVPVTAGRPATGGPGDTLVLLGPATADAPA